VEATHAQPEPVTTSEKVGDAYVVTVHGEIDAFTAPSLRDDLRALVEEQGARIVIVDLHAVTFLDSSALGALVGAVRRLRERNGELRIIQPGGAASRIFVATGLDAVLDLYSDRDAALSAASG
jgi:anti-sigma B factor antagonist